MQKKKKSKLKQIDITDFLKESLCKLVNGESISVDLTEIRKTAREISMQNFEREQQRKKLGMDSCKELREYYDDRQKDK